MHPAKLLLKKARPICSPCQYMKVLYTIRELQLLNIFAHLLGGKCYLILAVIWKFQVRPKFVNILLSIFISSHVIQLFSFFVHLSFGLLVSFLLIYKISINYLFIGRIFRDFFGLLSCLCCFLIFRSFNFYVGTPVNFFLCDLVYHMYAKKHFLTQELDG